MTLLSAGWGGLGRGNWLHAAWEELSIWEYGVELWASRCYWADL